MRDAVPLKIHLVSFSHLAVAVGNKEKLPPNVKKSAHTQMKNMALPPSGVAINVNIRSPKVQHNVNMAVCKVKEKEISSFGNHVFYLV